MGDALHFLCDLFDVQRDFLYCMSTWDLCLNHMAFSRLSMCLGVTHDGQVTSLFMDSGCSDDGGLQSCTQWPLHIPIEINGKPL